jgi:hypothetical protein
MARIEFEEFSGSDVSRIFVAANIREAEAAEALLTEHSITYALQIEEFVNSGPLTLSSAKNGVFFYVLAGQRDFCRQLLLRNGLNSGIIETDD